MAPPTSNVVQLTSVSSLSGDDCRLLVESVVDYAIFMLDPEGFIATWNPGAERIKGYTADEIVGQHFSTFYPASDIAAGKPRRELEVASAVGRFEDEGWRIRKDGSRFWANVVITALRDESGQLRGFGKVTRDLTTRRIAEEQLRHAEARFHHLVDAVIDYAIFMLDSTGHVATWNSGAHRVKGYAAAEILGKHFSNFYTAEDRAAGRPESILDTVRRDGRFEDEGWRVRKDGSRFWANVVITALRDDDGTVVGFAKVTRDLTARREAQLTERRLVQEQAAREAAEEAERRLRDSEERYRALSQRLEIVLEGVGDGITVQDRSGCVVFANSAAADLCGFDPLEGMENRSLADVIARLEILDEQGVPFDVTKFPGRDPLPAGQTQSAVLHVRKRESSRELWVQVKSTAAADGQLLINIWHDVTAQRRQDRQTRYLADATTALGSSLESDEMVSALAQILVPGLADWCSIYLLQGEQLRNAAVMHADPAKLAMAKDYHRRITLDPSRPRGVWNVVRTGKPELYNEVTREMLEQAAGDAAALEILRCLDMKAVLLAPLRVRRRILGVIVLVSAESGRRYDASDVALVEELGRRAGVALDNAHLYKTTQEAADAAEEASRVKDEFLATVSHELRTPLSAILGWATILKDRVEDPAIVKPIEVIHRNAQAQVRIIDDILDVSRIITGKFQLETKPTDLAAITREAIEVVRQSALAKRIEIQFTPPAELCLLVADPDRLQQVVWNLLSNAVKFTESGGRIRLAIEQNGSNVELSVKDTGKGIDPIFLPFVFDRFKQADSSTTRRVGGLGLGLAIVRHIVELHGGHVRATSEGVDKGATFTIILPVRTVTHPTSEPAAPQVKHMAPGVARDLAGVRVLVVDDEADARDLVGEVLANAGAIVATARSAAEGFETFRRISPDVLVSDIGMPEEDGLSFMRRVRALPKQEGGNVPSLALTAFAREEDRTKSLGAGFTTHIGKPVDPGALVAAVANLASFTRS